MRTREGALRSALFTALPIEVHGEPRILTISHDVTEEENAARERQAAFDQIAALKDQLERERDYLREEVVASRQFGEIVGTSTALQRVLTRVEALSETSVSVLITGETGVGKELIARAIHESSQRATAPLVRVNCASIPAELFESEFFGHVRGSFTGAHRDRVGRFELADGGTLFLDEVSEIPPALQSKLLRVLQDGEFTRVGEEATRRVDVRIIAATNRDLQAAVDTGRFRSDLFYRLSVFPLEVPPLRERRDDIPPLALHFLHLACRDSGRSTLSLRRAQADALSDYDWPGNVRELRNVIERAVILSPGERLRLDLALPVVAHAILRTSADESSDGQAQPDLMTAEELRHLQRANLRATLEHTGWKISGTDGAAALLGLKPSTVTSQVKALGIKKSG